MTLYCDVYLIITSSVVRLHDLTSSVVDRRRLVPGFKPRLC